MLCYVLMFLLQRKETSSKLNDPPIARATNQRLSLPVAPAPRNECAFEKDAYVFRAIYGVYAHNVGGALLAHRFAYYCRTPQKYSGCLFWASSDLC